MLHLQQFKDVDDWRQHRKRIGGSDAACVLGLNPFKTNVDLWAEKTGKKIPEDISDKSYVKYGNDAEFHLRELYALDHPQYKVTYMHNNLWTNDDYPFAHASLDGWLTDTEGRRGILEIKTSEIVSAVQSGKWKNQVPMNYYCQVLHYLAVTGFEFAELKAQLKYQFDDELKLITKHYHIERSEVQDDIELLMKAEERFWQNIQDGIEPDLILPQI